MFHSGHCSSLLLPIVSERRPAYNLRNRINSSAEPLVRTALHKNSFVVIFVSLKCYISLVLSFLRFFLFICMFVCLFVCFYAFNVVNVN